jgi:hypothetical protein
MLYIVSSITFVTNAQNVVDEILNISSEDDKLFVSFQLPAFEIRDTNLSESYNIYEQFSYIQINEEFGVIDSVGLPLLPQLTFDLHVPKNATKFTVKILSSATKTINVKNKIIPAQEDINLGEPVFDFQMNNNYYNSSGKFCDFYIQLSDSFIVFGEQGISLTVFPFLYNPREGKLTILEQGDFIVSYTLTAENTKKYSSDAKNNYLNELFKNHKSGGYPIQGRYLIVTDPSFESMLTYFANYKRNIGFEVIMVNTHTTGTTPASIKNYIQNQYNDVNTRPDYVLLVGDHVHIPAYKGNIYGSDIDNPITDLDYVLLEGKDNIADAFLGRFSVENGEQLKNIINKTVFMEMNMHRFSKEAKFLAGDELYGTKAHQRYMKKEFEKGHDYVIDYSFKYLSYNCQTLYQPNQTDAINALNNNPLFYIYSGHGSIVSISGYSFKIVDNDISSATNRVFPCVFSFACLTGNFASTCIGESFIRAKNQGAVAYFGASVNSLTNSDIVIEKKIFGDAFKKDEQNLSAIINLGMRRFSYSGLIAKKKKTRYLKAYNLLGDPSFDTKGIGCKEDFVFKYSDIFDDNSEITYQANNHIENQNSFIVQNGSNVKLFAGKSINLKPGFKADRNSYFEARIIPCNDGSIYKSLSDNFIEPLYSIEYNEKNEIINPAIFSVFPNPNSADFSVTYTIEENGFLQMDIYNISGVLIKNLLPLSQQQAGTYYYNFSLSDCSSGVYILTLKNNNKIYSTKIIIK